MDGRIIGPIGAAFVDSISATFVYEFSVLKGQHNAYMPGEAVDDCCKVNFQRYLLWSLLR